MPRQPTGRPPGRPVGSGAVLEREQTRLTVRIPATLYDRLEAFVEGLHFTHGTPQLASCVRDALEHFLDCPHKRQTQNVQTFSSNNNGQTENCVAYSWQTENGTDAVVPMQTVAEETIRQTENSTALEVLPAWDAGEDNRQTGNVPADVPAYDQARFQLGKLCSRGHAYGNTGQSLREIRQGKGADCAECHRERARAANARRLVKQGAGQ